MDSTRTCSVKAAGRAGRAAPSPHGSRVGVVGLCLLAGPACGSGEKACASGEGSGILALSFVPEDDYAESMQEYFDDRMQLIIIHLYEEPESDARCTHFPSDGGTVVYRGLDVNEEFDVASGWNCVITRGDSHGNVCYGYLAPMDIPTCGYIEASMAVTCEIQYDEGD